MEKGKQKTTESDSNRLLRMEVNNRFNLLASLSLDDQITESVSNEVIVSEPKQDNQHSTKNLWEIPDYVEKPIPCVNLLVPKEEKSTSVIQRKPSRRSKTNKIKIEEPHYEEEEEEQPEVEISSTVEVNPQPAIVPIYPPQPYKFKPTNASKV